MTIIVKIRNNNYNIIKKLLSTNFQVQNIPIININKLIKKNEKATLITLQN